ncbi:hypothetical protein GNF11_27925 [Nostoc sp. UCD122]|nr:hypothetical protein [Nostoc sp. UCD122]
MQLNLPSPAMKIEEYVAPTGAGGAEPLPDMENCCVNSCVTGAEKLESGAGESEEVASSEDSKVLASEAIACILESPDPSWEVIKDILGEMEIASYSELHGFLTLGEFAQLEMLVRAAESEVDMPD